MTLLSALAFGFMFTSIGSYGWYLAISGGQAGDKKKQCISGYRLSDDGTQCVNRDGEVGPPPGTVCPDYATWKNGCCEVPAEGPYPAGCVSPIDSQQANPPKEPEDRGFFYNFGKFIDDCFFYGGLYILD